MKMTILKNSEINSAQLEAAGVRAGADVGEPQVKTLGLAQEAPGNIGIWECTPGGWPVNDREDTEVCYILAGKAQLTDNSTVDVVDVSTGDLLILPKGWSGRWYVTETVKKIYVIY